MNTNTCCLTINTCCLRAKMAAGLQNQTPWIIYHVRCVEMTVCFGGLVALLPVSKWHPCLPRAPMGTGASGPNMKVPPSVTLHPPPPPPRKPFLHPSSYSSIPPFLYLHPPPFFPLSPRSSLLVCGLPQLFIPPFLLRRGLFLFLLTSFAILLHLLSPRRAFSICCTSTSIAQWQQWPWPEERRGRRDYEKKSNRLWGHWTDVEHEK